MKRLKPCLILLLFFFAFSLIFPPPARSVETLHFLHQDHLSSTTLVTDGKREVVSQQVYYPYGFTRATQGSLPTERQYTSQVSDLSQTGLYYYNARYYNPQIALFTQADAVKGPNRYLYAANNPINKNDPSGNQPAKLIRGASGIESGGESSAGLYLTVVLKDYAESSSPTPYYAPANPKAGYIDYTYYPTEKYPLIHEKTGWGRFKDSINMNVYESDLRIYNKYFSEYYTWEQYQWWVERTQSAALASAGDLNVNYTHTPVMLSRNLDYRGGFNKFVADWYRGLTRDKRLYLRPGDTIPSVPHAKTYGDFREAFGQVYAEIEQGQVYRGIYTISRHGNLRVSFDPGVKHGMLTGGRNSLYAGEFTCGWFEEGGKTLFKIFTLDFQSGGYTPIIDPEKLEAAWEIIRYWLSKF